MAAASRMSVLHLVGSAVDDFHARLSLLYARACLAALEDFDRYDMHIAYVSPDGSWRFPEHLGADALSAAAPMPISGALKYLRALRVDVALPQMFCLPGMTTYRRLLSALGIPYIGNTPEVMAAATDKSLARDIVAEAGVAVPAGQVVRAGERPTVRLPVVVKPVCADNSERVALVRDPLDLDAVISMVLDHDPAALVEEYIELGREVRCGIVVRDGEPVCLPLEEYAVDPVSKPIRGYADKLRRADGGDLALVAKDPGHAWIVPVDDPITEVVWEAARRCHHALGCRHYSLFDFRIDPYGRPWFLEAGLYCSFAPTSVVAVMAAAAGIGVAELFADQLRQLNLARTPCSSTPR
jgi:D-alanine-D-alanine ligase